MAGNVVQIQDFREKKDEILEFSDSSGCQLCLKNPSKYTCPRCNVKYCSVECYRSRKHVDCSENFYKKCVMSALQGDTVDEHERRKMMEVLKRFEAEEKDESLPADEIDLGENLQDRLEGLNLDQDTEKIWEKLTQEEKKEFQRAVDDGYIGSLIDSWKPWWNTTNTSLDEPIESETSGNNDVPKLLKNIPHLSTLINSKLPSAQTKYNLVNILYGYVYVCRCYNGCHHDFLQEAVDKMWKLSAVLYHTVNFSSLENALRSAVKAIQQDKELFNSEEFSLSIIDDISLLLRENDSRIYYVEAALSDLHRLFANAIKICKNACGSKDHAKALWFAKKKVLFMLSWFYENKDECLTLVPFLPIIKEAMTLEVKQLQEEKVKVKKSRMGRSGKKLIEELN